MAIKTKLDREKIKALLDEFEGRSGLPVSQLENLDDLKDEEIAGALRSDMTMCRDQVEDGCQWLERELGRMLEDAGLDEE